MRPPGVPVRRLAVGLTAGNEAEFVALVELARPLLAGGAPAVLVVPALDHRATARRVGALLGEGAGVVVEPAHEYLVRGHDRVALVGDDPVARGHGMAEALAWLRSPPGAAPVVPDGSPDPADVLAWLGSSGLPAPPPGTRTSGSVGNLPVQLGNDRVLLRTAWNAKLLAFGSDRSLTPDLVLDGVYDPSFVRFLERNVAPGGFAVDVGANIGLFTVRLAQLVGPSGHVLALEADPAIHGILQENLDLNYVSGWARAVAVAAYSSRAELTFHHTTRFRGNGSLLESSARGVGGYVTEEHGTTTVDAAPLDDLLGDEAEVALVKIDVEGAERHVLEGMSRTITEGRVRTVAIEFVKAVFGSEWAPLCALLDRYRECFGASFATVAPDGSRVPRTLESAMEIGAFPQLVIDFGAGA